MCALRFGFSYIGLIWLLMLYVPNLLWTKRQPENYALYAEHESRVLLVFERVGEGSVTVAAVVFSDFNPRFPLSFWSFWLLASLLCMLLYEVFWIRYFRSPRTMLDFYCGLCGIPLAGATLPVLAFLLLAFYGGNIVLLASTLLLGVGHIGIHAAHRKQALADTPERQ